MTADRLIRAARIHGKDKVAEFVKTKGDGMSYPVAYTGKGGVFETE